MNLKRPLSKKSEKKKIRGKNADLIKSGDVGIFSEDGYLRIVDRTKDMIIVGGFKVFSAKLEDEMIKHPAIEQVATIGIPNPDRPGSEIMKAFIMRSKEYLNQNVEMLKEKITKWVKEKVAPYEVPKIIEFRSELPLTVVGKVNKKLLRQETTMK